jgi:hypothetical protein
MIVVNAENTSNLECPCKVWIKHWELYSGFKAEKCSVIDCAEPVDVGGHVLKNKGDNMMYIIPLCKKHNGFEFHGQELDVYRTLITIPAKDMGCCGKTPDHLSSLILIP